MPNEPGGAIQVLDNTMESINQALAQLLERVDDLKGLRGAVTVHDRLEVQAPLNPLDAVNLDTLVNTFVGNMSTPFGWPALANTQRPGELQGEDSELNAADPLLWLLTDHAIGPDALDLDPHDPFLWLFGAGNEQGGSEPQNAPPNVTTSSDIGTIAGRYAREDHTHGVTVGSFTITGTGFADPDPTGTALYVLVGPFVALFIPELTGTSDATTMTLTGIPAAIQPTQTGDILNLRTTNTTANAVGVLRVSASSTWEVFPNANAGVWGTTSTKTLYAGWIDYHLL